MLEQMFLLQVIELEDEEQDVQKVVLVEFVVRLTKAAQRGLHVLHFPVQIASN